MSETPRETLRLVVAGHVDHGKSTVVGRLLADTGALPKGRLERVEAYCRLNSKPFEFAFLLDALKDEQRQGITIEAARGFFKTARRDYAVVDAPGHSELLRNMISGASRADAAFLVLDVRDPAAGNARRHAYLLSFLGLRQVLVLVNKMDLAGYSEQAFRRAVREHGSFLDSIGVEAAGFIPISGRHGDNLAAASSRMPWYAGPTALSALDALGAPAPALSGPFRMPVQDVYGLGEGRGRAFVGTVESGSLAVGDEVIFYPSGKSGRVKSFEEFPASARAEVCAGMAAAFSLAEPPAVERGELAARPGQRPPLVAARFQARLLWLGVEPLTSGKDYVLKLGAARTAVRLEKAGRVLDSSSLAAKAGAAQVERNQVADCVLRAEAAVAFDAGARFVIVDNHRVCGGGFVEKL